jgi:hypothetical protein
MQHKLSRHEAPCPTEGGAAAAAAAAAAAGVSMLFLSFLRF